MDPSRFVRDVLDVWKGDPRLADLASAVEPEADALTSEVADILAEPQGSFNARMDRARSHLVNHAMGRIHEGIDTEAFVLFRDRETVEVILEDCFGMEPGSQSDRPSFPQPETIIRMIARCLFPKRAKAMETEDLIAFLRLLANQLEEGDAENDRAMRFKTLVWLGYLLLDLFRVDRNQICEGGLPAIRSRLRQLLDAALEGTIIDESTGSDRYNLEGGKWDRTLFGWMQGEDRRPFVRKLVRQLNFENRKEHSSRMLLAEHRDCMYRQAMEQFC